jgi:hypothetical protein
MSRRPKTILLSLLEGLSHFIQLTLNLGDLTTLDFILLSSF